MFCPGEDGSRRRIKLRAEKIRRGLNLAREGIGVMLFMI
jgi:hypothetical protein